MEKLQPINALYFCLKAVRSVSGSDGSPKIAAKLCDEFIKVYEAHHATSAEAIPVAGIVLGQFFLTEQNLKDNTAEILLQAKELASDSGFYAAKFDMTLQKKTALGAMCIVMTRQNKVIPKESK